MPLSGKELSLPLLIAGLYVAFSSSLAAQQKIGQPVNVSGVNTAADEDDPFITSDLLKLYYASNATGTFDIYVSKRTTPSQPFFAGKPILGVNTRDADERSPFFSRDGNFYFATNAIPDDREKDRQNFDLKRRIGDRIPLPLLGIS